MSITSYVYFIFVAVVIFFYYVMPLKCRQWVLLAASIFFYVYGCGFPLFSMMCAMALFAWIGAIGIEGQPEAQKGKVAVWVVAILAAVLILLKDFAFFMNNAKLMGKFFQIEKVFGIAVGNLKAPEWVAPVGISYFALMLIGYVLDVNWGIIKAEKNPLKVILFTCYFPQMVLGPITRYNQMEQGLFTGHRFDYEQFLFGLQRVMWGLFKKLVIAERFAMIVGTIFGNYEALGGGYVFIGALAYTGQLYADFSSAMDMVIGVSQMLGIVLPENFRQPFHSRSLSEIWRRWHMTLGFWLKDYVMFPVQKALTTKFGKLAKQKLGKKWGKNSILYFSMLVTWFCVGFWHGGTWKYICASGLFFFMMIVGGMLLQPLFNRLKRILRINTEAWSWHLFESLRSFLLFTLSVSFGRAASLTDGLRMWRLAFTNIRQNVLDVVAAWADKSIYASIGIDLKDLQILVVALLVLLFISTLQLKMSVRESLGQQNIVFRWTVFLLLFASILIYGLYGVGYNPSDFIYAGF